jgi:type IV pilus assembly protein PilW
MIRVHKTKGFTLVELMIGVVIGMIVTIIVFQVLTSAERQKRTTAGTADAQGSGALALATIGQNARMAGAGLLYSAFNSCTNINAFKNDGNWIDDATRQGASLFQPVTITHSGTLPDTISFLSYNHSTSANVRLSTLLLTNATYDIGDDSATFNVTASRSCSIGGIALLAQNGSCALISISGGSVTSIEHKHGGDPVSLANWYNPPPDTFTVPTFAQEQTTIQCLDGLYSTTYQIDSTTHELQAVEPLPRDPNDSNTTTQAPNVVDMRAQYGINDTGAASGTLRWVETEDGTGYGNFAAPKIGDVRKIRAVRVAILVRNAEYQKPSAGSTCDATTSTMLADMSDWAGFSDTRLEDNGMADWACYRYKAFEQAMPLRNTLWSVSN